KQAQIQNSIAKALDGLTFENQFEGFGAVQDRIREAQSEAQARQEIMGQSITGRVMTMEDKARDMEAESELDKLEEKVGLRQPYAPVVETNTQTVSVGGPPDAPKLDAAQEAQARSEAERQLEELEKRLKGN